jgi:hypothetical protein
MFGNMTSQMEEGGAEYRSIFAPLRFMRWSA